MYEPKWHMAIINTLDCSVIPRFCGYWLAIGWLYTNINILQDTVKYQYVQSGTWLLSILWTVECSQGFLAIGWLYPKINTLQNIVIYYYVPRVHMAAINTLGCSVFTRFFGYWLAISQNLFFFFFSPWPASWSQLFIELIYRISADRETCTYK